MEERIPPHSDDAERSVLGAAMLDEDVLLDILTMLVPEDFYKEAHREIFDAIRSVNRSGSAVDIVTVSEELQKRKTLEMSGGRAYVASLPAEVPTVSNAADYAAIVKDKSVLRRLIHVAGDITEKSFAQKADAGKVVDYAEQKVFAITQDA